MGLLASLCLCNSGGSKAPRAAAADPRAAEASREALLAAACGDVQGLSQALAVPGCDLSAWEGRQQWTALHLAAAGGHTACVETLVQHGADLEARSADGLTPLHVAAGGGRTACLAVLGQLVGGALLSECNPAHGLQTRQQALRALLAAGADVEAEAIRGIRGLHFAAANGEVPILETLLTAGANPAATLRSPLAPTAGQVAGAYGHLHAAQLLTAAEEAAAEAAGIKAGGAAGGMDADVDALQLDVDVLHLEANVLHFHKGI
ncbi:hypothetical protein D9Q98_007690 [Chlorella vulgaris]|uniref:Uncharacterized protein n=1 Tax=Chlorella vulgaris TaxID=3077 RepID=A0A9D4YTM1_CHLVU|nr:hypothetical protein D9Q98_007690 [Chlorella vulgaris]